MRAHPYLCVDTHELANGDRTLAYIQAGLGPPGASAGSGCEPCDAIGDGDYVSPLLDPAEWYVAGIDGSEEFLGIIANRIEVLAAVDRSMDTRVGGGGVLGPSVQQPRVLTFTGTMIASSSRGMAHGEAWVREVLAGARCNENCRGAEVLYLPACPPDDYAVPDRAFRRIIGAGISSGPIFSDIGNLPPNRVQGVSFQLTSSLGYVYGLEETIMDAVVLDSYGEDAYVAAEMTGWNGDMVFYIEVEATTAAGEVRLEARRAPNGDCPPDEGMPCWTATIPSIPTNGKVIFDGVREEIRWYDPTRKIEKSGLSMVDLNGPPKFPVAGPCETLCIHAEVTTGTVEVSVDTIVRER